MGYHLPKWTTAASLLPQRAEVKRSALEAGAAVRASAAASRLGERTDEQENEVERTGIEPV